MTTQQILELQPTNGFVVESFQLVKERIYSRAYSYSGPAESCLFSFSLLPDQIPGTDWISQRVVNAFASAMTTYGREMLELRLWEDKSPTWHTDYQCEIIYTDPGATTSAFSPAVAHVGVIIAAVLGILFIVAITFFIMQVNRFLYGVPGENGVPGFGSTIMALLPMFLLIMMMGMMTPMMASMEAAEQPKEIE